MWKFGFMISKPFESIVPVKRHALTPSGGTQFSMRLSALFARSRKICAVGMSVRPKILTGWSSMKSSPIISSTHSGTAVFSTCAGLTCSGTTTSPVENISWYTPRVFHSQICVSLRHSPFFTL